MPNEYELLVNLHENRGKLVREYSWAIPNDKAIETIVKYSPVVEIGAGTGYWASLIEKAGGKIIAFDKNPAGDENPFGHETLYYPVQKADYHIADKYPSHTLMLCWPPYRTKVASGALNAHRLNGGTRIIYIGEGYCGCTGDDKFHELLEKYYEEIEEVEIPTWRGMHDCLGIYTLKG